MVRYEDYINGLVTICDTDVKNTEDRKTGDAFMARLDADFERVGAIAKTVDNFVTNSDDMFNCFSKYNPATRVVCLSGPEIKKIIFNGPATIVFWTDGTKTIVKCSKDDDYDMEKGIMAAICKRVYGNSNLYAKKIKKWLPK